MTGQTDGQAKAAASAAKARQVIADRIARLVPEVKNDEQAQVVVHLAEAYANLAAEPPRIRAG